MSTSDRRDVIDVLSGEHRVVEVLFWRLETGGPGVSRKSLAAALALALAWHTAATERFLAPLTRRSADGDALADRHTAERLAGDIEHMARELAGSDPSDARFEPLLARLVAAGRGHIDHEEKITFVELTRACDRGELLAAGAQLAAARARAELSSVVPAQAGPAGLEAGPAPSVVDRVRAVLGS